MFKKTFWVPYENGSTYPTPTIAIDAILKYCESTGDSCIFTANDEVEISGVKYGIYRGCEMGNGGSYGIKCTEK